MENKICVVTGATSGIGQVTASALAQAGARVIVVGRDAERCKRVAEQIRLETANHRVEFRVANLASQAAVRALAADLNTNLPRIDVLINNAGAVFWKRTLSPDKIEMTWALNHLAYMLLTDSLMERLKAAPAARIINVSSDAHRMGKIHFDDLQYERKYVPFGAYSQSKLANVMYTYELARRLAGTSITANTLHPGLVATRFGSGQPGFISWGYSLMTRIIGIGTREGAETTIYLAKSPQVEGVSGKYFYKCKEKKSSPASYDAAAGKRLWDISEQMLHTSW